MIWRCKCAELWVCRKCFSLSLFKICKFSCSTTIRTKYELCTEASLTHSSELANILLWAWICPINGLHPWSSCYIPNWKLFICPCLSYVVVVLVVTHASGMMCVVLQRMSSLRTQENVQSAWRIWYRETPSLDCPASASTTKGMKLCSGSAAFL